MPSIFSLKQFSLLNELSPMKIGTDSLLVGAWTDVSAAQSALQPRVLDVGCGTGIIAMMLAQRLPEASIEAIDIDADAVAEASENFATSQFAARMKAYRADFNDLSTLSTYAPNASVCPTEGHREIGAYELIVCNPPFFNETLVSPDANRAKARHELSLTIAALCRKSAELLTPTGSLALIAPYSRAADVIEAATFAGLHVWRRCDVTTVVSKPPRRTLWQLTLRQNPLPPEHTSLTIHADNNVNAYSADYQKLLSPFKSFQ